MFTDTEIGLSLAHRRSMRAFANDAQSLVDDMDADIRSLRAKLKSALAAVDDERALRLIAEHKLAKMNKLLDTPLN